MNITLRYVLPAMLLLAGCATSDAGYSYTVGTAATGSASPERVGAVSDALGAKMANMLTAGRANTGDVTR